MGLALLVGAILARHGQYRLHHYWQSFIVLLNLLLIAAIMLPSFDRNVLPQLPSSLRTPYYTIVVVHAALGLIVQLLALYVVLAAGTNLLPGRWRFTRFKPWMRTTLALWWLVLLLGAATYYVWYVQTSPLPLRLLDGVTRETKLGTHRVSEEVGDLGMHDPRRLGVVRWELLAGKRAAGGHRPEGHWNQRCPVDDELAPREKAGILVEDGVFLNCDHAGRIRDAEGTPAYARCYSQRERTWKSVRAAHFPPCSARCSAPHPPGPRPHLPGAAPGSCRL